MEADASLKKLVEYRDNLEASNWDWVIPRQDVVGKIVSKLVDGIVWPVMSGSYWPADYPTVQRQWVESAIFNLEADPSLAKALGPKDPWIETAERLEVIAESMPSSDWVGHALEAQQLVAAINQSAADQISDMVEKHPMFGASDFPEAREKVIGVIRGAAGRARLHGPS